MISVSFFESSLIVNEESYDLGHPVVHAFASSGIIVALLDPDSYVEKFGQFANLRAYAQNGLELWRAELPTTSAGDCYYQIKTEDPLIADSVFSFSCELDLSSGKIVQKSFYK